MRTIEEIKAHIEKVEREDCPRACSEESFHGWKAWKITALKAELLDAVTDGITLSRLEEICNADRECRCVVLPCKVGDEMFSRRWSIKNEKLEVKSGKVRTVRYDAADADFMVSDGEMFGLLGRDVFLTREAAEAALGVAEHEL